MIPGLSKATLDYDDPRIVYGNTDYDDPGIV